MFPVKWCILHFLFICRLFSINAEIQITTYDEDQREICPTDFDSDHINDRVVGGKNANKNKFRFASGLLMQYVSTGPVRTDLAFCGGTLITDRHIMTAGHCVYQRQRDSRNMRINIGDYDLMEDNEVQNYVRQVKRMYLHPKYEDETFNNDIAIIELEEPVPFENGMRAAILPPAGVDLSVGTMCTVLGWGRTSYEGSRAHVLQQVDVPVTGREECQRHLSHEITENMICAGGKEGEDACLGDSGGGLFVRIGNSYVTCGVVSFGKKCALKDVSGVYTDVSRYIDWIYEKTRSASCKPRIYPKRSYVQ